MGIKSYRIYIKIYSISSTSSTSTTVIDVPYQPCHHDLCLPTDSPIFETHRENQIYGDDVCICVLCPCVLMCCPKSTSKRQESPCTLALITNGSW